MANNLRNKRDPQDVDSIARMKKNVLNGRSSFATVEAYKAARTNLMFTRKKRGCQVIAVTSSFMGEGKTTNCVNLAITLAQNGLRVLLIDADMRRPVVQRLFGIKDSTGLSNFLAGFVDLHDLIREDGLIHLTWCDNLYVLTSGHNPPNPAELLASVQMESLIRELSGSFDYIMIDTPPVSVVTDAAVLAKLVDGYVFVVRAGKTPMDALKDSVLRLEQVGASIAGFILNDVNIKSSYNKYGGKYKRYGEYGRYGHNVGVNGQYNESYSTRKEKEQGQIETHT